MRGGGGRWLLGKRRASVGEEKGGENHLDLLYTCRKLPKNKMTPKHYGGKGTLNK